MDSIAEIAFSALIETILVSGILGFLFIKREERMKKAIEEEFRKRDTFFNAQFNFKLRALEELLAPISLQFIRSSITLKNYKANDAYREKILKECNETVRNLLLQKGFLIPSDLLSSAEKLITHYDGWLQAYEETRQAEDKKDVSHVFTYDFPHDAEKAFKGKFESYLAELKIQGSL